MFTITDHDDAAIRATDPRAIGRWQPHTRPMATVAGDRTAEHVARMDRS